MPIFLKTLLEMHKGIGAEHVNVGDMRMAIIPVPPFAEQLRILERIAEISCLCADLRRRLIDSQATQRRLTDAVAEAATA